MTGTCSCFLLGTVCEPCELLTSKSGKPWLLLVIEVKTYRRSPEGGGQEEETRLPVAVFSKTAEIAHQYLKVGDPVAISARVTGTEYTDKRGTSRRGVSLVADQLHLIPPSRSNSSDRPKSSSAPRSAPATKDRDWDRKPQMREVERDSEGNPLDVNF
jgi:single-stranded DNA-binding protein